MTTDTQDFSHLRALAEAATPGPHHIYTHPRDDNNCKANEAWHAACEPQTVIALLDKLAALQAHNERLIAAYNMGTESYRALQAENEAVRKANIDCVNHFDALRVDYDAALARLAAIEKQPPFTYYVPTTDKIRPFPSDGDMPLYAAAGASPVQPSQAGEPDTIKKLGKRLAELLDEDQFAECEVMLLAINNAGPTAQPSQAGELSDAEIWKFWWNKPEVSEGEDDSMEAEFVAAVRRILAAINAKESK